MDKTLNILIIEDNSDDAFLIKKLIERAGIKFKLKLISEKPEFTDAIAAETFDVIITDNSMFKFDALDVLTILKQKSINTPVIILSGTITDEAASAMVKAGAFDYIKKDNIIKIAASIRKAAAQFSISPSQPLPATPITKKE